MAENKYLKPVNLDTIWRVPAYLPYLQPPLTEHMISAAESSIGYSLPKELLDLLRKQNGGYIRFTLPDMIHDKIAGIGPHFPSLLDFDWEEVQEYVSYPLQGLVPFDGDGHWHLCLDYRTSQKQPSITYVDVECDSQSQVARSFSEYLDSLILEIADEFVVDSVDLEMLLSNLAEILKTTFEPPDIWAHGYPTYRAPIGTKDSPQWIWISPNRVLRGFVREDDYRYDELKNYLPGYGLRYPELTETSLIVRVTNGALQKVIKAFNHFKYQLNSIHELMNRI